jgi:hypothetical protein
MHTKFFSETLKGRDHAEDSGVDGRIILEWILGKYGEKVWTGCAWVKIAITDGIL